jgi:hypothetical protein
MTAHGVDRVAADKAQTYCPRLEGLAPWFFGKASCPDTYELLNNSRKGTFQSFQTFKHLASFKTFSPNTAPVQDVSPLSSVPAV